MKTITFSGHIPVPQRQVTLTRPQLRSAFEAMKLHLKDHITYGTFTSGHDLFPEDSILRDLCKAHEVDAGYKKDRVAFLHAVIDSMENPYD